MAVQQNQCLEECLDGIPTPLVTSLLVTSGERQNWEEIQEKAHLKYSLSSGTPFSALFGSLMYWGGHNCPCPSLLCMCMCACVHVCVRVHVRVHVCVHAHNQTGESPWEFHCVPWENLVKERQACLPPCLLEICWALLSSAFGVLWALV